MSVWFNPHWSFSVKHFQYSSTAQDEVMWWEWERRRNARTEFSTIFNYSNWLVTR